MNIYINKINTCWLTFSEPSAYKFPFEVDVCIAQTQERKEIL